VHRRHLLALLRAALARVRALLAMLHVVLSAFLSAFSARLSAQPADVCRKIRITAHQQRGGPAQGRAVSIQLDATRHHIHVTLTQALTCAPRAFVGAVVTGFYAIDVFLISHNAPLLSSSAAACDRPRILPRLKKFNQSGLNPSGRGRIVMNRWP